MLSRPVKSVSFDTIKIIHNSLKASFENKATFPEHVQTVASVGVIHYCVDLLQRKVTYRLNDDLTHIEEFPPLEAKANGSFSKEAVQSAVLEIQKKSIDYPTFLKKLIAGGSVSYEVDLVTKKVTYWGANRESHTELFPGVKPPVTESTIPRQSRL